MNTNNLRFSIMSFFTLALISKMLIFQPSLTFAQTRCENCYRAAVIDEVDTNAGGIVERSILGLIAEAFISHCFHIQCPIEVIPEEFRYMVRTKPPEYLFRASFYEKLPGEITSRMEIQLYYNGKTEEFVRSWSTEHDSKIVYYRAHRNKWFHSGEKSIARKIRPIELTVLNDFEKRPWKCDISVEKDEICPGDEISVLLTNIHDIAGKQSREFNRVVVQTIHGEIIGGTPLELDQNYKAFQVEGGTITFTYRAPIDGTKEDSIYVYNSCDILRQDLYPLSKTLLEDKIAEKKIRIKTCYDAIAKITGKEIITEKGEMTYTGGAGSDTHKTDYRREIEATVHVMFERMKTLSMPVFNEYLEYYKVKSIKLASFRAKLQEWDYSYLKKTDSWNEVTEIWTGQGTNPKLLSIKIIPGQTGQAIAVFDKKTKKAKAVNLLTAGGVEYKWTVKFDQEGRGEAPPGPHHFTHSDTKEDKKIFAINTVDGPGKTLPHSTSIFSPDFLVTSGDGVYFMAGSGKVITDNFSPKRKESFSQCSTEKTYSWEFRRMKIE